MKDIKFADGPDGRFNGASNFNGATSEITIKNTKFLNVPFSFSVLMDVYPEKTGTLFEYVNGVMVHFDLSGGRGELQFYAYEEGRATAAPVSVKVGEKKWHHIAITYEYTKGLAIVFVNGERQIGQRTFSANRKIGTAGDIKIGTKFVGRISCVQIYEKVLGAADIAKVKKCPLGEDGIKGKW